MPPVMGAGAFVMAEITNIPYQTIALAAIAGSLLYFFMILISVHFEARQAAAHRLRSPTKSRHGPRSCGTSICSCRSSS